MARSSSRCDALHLAVNAHGAGPAVRGPWGSGRRGRRSGLQGGTEAAGAIEECGRSSVQKSKFGQKKENRVKGASDFRGRDLNEVTEACCAV